MDLKINYKW